MSSSLKSQDDYLVYEIPSADPEHGHGSVVIIPKSSQGFSWNEGPPCPCPVLACPCPLSLPYSLSDVINSRRLSLEISVKSVLSNTFIRIDGRIPFQR
jgi:hypothetical protein